MGFTGGINFKAPASLSSILEVDQHVDVLPSSKLICTIGPACNDVDTLSKLLSAGMAVARFDLSYGDKQFHAENVRNLQKAVSQTKKLCAVMLDSVGPEVVVLNRPADAIEIEAGQSITLTCDPNTPSSSSIIAITYPGFESSGVQPGTSLFIGQYLFTGSETTSAYLTVQQVSENTCQCICNNSCVLEGAQLTVHIANARHQAPILSSSDMEILSYWSQSGLPADFLSISFCRNAQDVSDCRSALDSLGMRATKLVAKIENREGLSNYEEVLEAADALIFSRGNLGVCLDAEKVFLAQKMVLKACNNACKPVFVTRVVDTMCDAPRPTRAEATDVANLILDGADGILLGAETFRGKYVLDTVKTVLAICKQAEQCFDSEAHYNHLMQQAGNYSLHPNMSKTEALASAAVRAAAKQGAALIVVFTVTGRTARLVAKYRPSQRILTVVAKDPQVFKKEGSIPASIPPTENPQDSLEWTWNTDVQLRQCLLNRGVVPIPATPGEAGTILARALETAKSLGMVKDGDCVVVSQCPRETLQPNMTEVGLVKSIMVGSHLPSTAASALHLGSFDDLSPLANTPVLP